MLRSVALPIGILLFVLQLVPCQAADKPAVDKKSAAANWPQWRGPKRDGVSTETGLLKEWPKEGPTLAWKAAGLGKGFSSVTIAAGKLLTMGEFNDGQYTICLNLADGKQLWKKRVGDKFDNYAGPRSSPTFDGPLCYALGANGDLVCLKVADGDEVWRVNFKSFDGKKGDGWGYSESVLVDGNRLVCTPGGEKATMIALNKKTGAPLWKMSQPGNRGAGHASIVISTIGGTRVYVQTTASGAIGVREKDGKLLWNYDIDGTTAVIPTPIVRDDLVFFTAGYGRGGALLKQVPAGKGEVTVQEIYPLNNKLGNKHGGVVLVGDYLYGDSDDSGVPFCAELMTGKIKWKKRGSGGGSVAVTAAEGNLYMRYQDGVMALLSAIPEESEEKGNFKIPNVSQPSWPHPVIAGGKLYLREQDNLFCYDIKK